MDKLTEFLIRPFVEDMGAIATPPTVTPKDKVKKLIVIYPGRFQPPSLHHKKVYDWLAQKFGPTNVFIASSGKIELPDSPLSFSEKKAIWVKHGVPTDKIVETKSPYNSDEILRKVEEKTTAALFVFGQKDADRLAARTKKSGEAGYFLPYAGNEDKLQPCRKHGYFIVAPHISVIVNGKELSGTNVREILGSKKISEKSKEQLFQKIFGWFDEYLYHLIVPKFVSSTNEAVTPVLSELYLVKNLINNHAITELKRVLSKLDDDTLYEFLLEHDSVRQVLNEIAINPSLEDAFSISPKDVGCIAIKTIKVVDEPRKELGEKPITFFRTGDVKKDVNLQSPLTDPNNSVQAWKQYVSDIANKIGYKITDFIDADESRRMNYSIDNMDDKSDYSDVDAKTPSILSEGGNVFDDTSDIALENIDPTIEKFVAELSRIFPNKAKSFLAFEKLGSVGKKPQSGDLDLAYSSKEFIDENGKPRLKEWGVSDTDFKMEFDKIKSRAKTATDAQSSLRAMLNLVGTYISKKSKLLEVTLKATVNAILHFKFPQFDINKKPQKLTVQIDINVGDLDWLRFSYYSNVYQGNVKGLHRTQLMLALFNTKGKMFKHNTGVLDKETRQVEASNPTEAIQLLNKLYGVKFTPDILQDYFKLLDFIQKNLSKEDYTRTIDSYLKILDSTRADIPSNLQDYWIKNQSRLGLLGKFLPDDSKLTPYKK